MKNNKKSLKKLSKSLKKQEKNIKINKNDIVHRERFYIDRKGEPVKTELLSK